MGFLSSFAQVAYVRNHSCSKFRKDNGQISPREEGKRKAGAQISLAHSEPCMSFSSDHLCAIPRDSIHDLAEQWNLHFVEASAREDRASAEVPFVKISRYR